MLAPGGGQHEWTWGFAAGVPLRLIRVRHRPLIIGNVCVDEQIGSEHITPTVHGFDGQAYSLSGGLAPHAADHDVNKTTTAIAFGAFACSGVEAQRIAA